MTAESVRRTPISLFGNPEFVALATLRFAWGVTHATILIALALYADQFEASGVIVGSFGTAYALARLTMVLPVGRLVDVGDSKRYLLAGLALNAAVLLGFTVVESAGQIIVLRALQGAGSALLVVTGMAVLGEIAPSDERGLWIGTYSQFGAVSSLAGDLLGGAILFLYGFTATYAFLLAVTGVAVVAIFLQVDEDPGETVEASERTGMETLRKLVSQNLIRALVFFRFGFSFTKTAVVLFLPIYARLEFGLSALAIGGIMAGGKLTKSLSQGYVGTLADRVGHLHWFVVAGALLYAVGTALIPFAPLVSGVMEPVAVPGFGGSVVLQPAFFGLFAAYVVLGIADSLRITAEITLFVEEGSLHDAVAGSLSLRSLPWQVGGLIGPIFFGILLDRLSFLAGFWLTAGMAVSTAFVFLVLYDDGPGTDAES